MHAEGSQVRGLSPPPNDSDRLPARITKAGQSPILRIEAQYMLHQDTEKRSLVEFGGTDKVHSGRQRMNIVLRVQLTGPMRGILTVEVAIHSK